MPAVSVRHIGGGQLVGTARQHAVVIDKLPEKGGTGTGLIPTELLLLSLGSCMSFNMLHYAERNQMAVTDLQVELSDEISEAPTRISKVVAKVRVSGDLTEEQLARLLRTVKGCKIHNTLSHLPQIEISIQKE
jgi:putative redox protein